MEYVLHILVFVGIYAILSVSLNLVAGYTGMLSIAHAAFYGVGAYAAALLGFHCQAPFPLLALGAMAASGLAGAVFAVSALRTRDDYFVIATFALQVVAVGVMTNWVDVTGGPMGLSGIPAPTLLGWKVDSNIEYVALVGGCCTVVVLVARRLAVSPYGRVLKAIREDEILAQAFGKNAYGYRMTAFVAGAAMAGLAGALYATYISFIDPTSFTVMESIFIISVVIVGGAGSLRGSIVGAVVMVLLPEVLRAIGLPAAIAAHLRQILYGGLLVAFIMWRPQGLVGEYTFQASEDAQ